MHLLYRHNENNSYSFFPSLPPPDEQCLQSEITDTPYRVVEDMWAEDMGNDDVVAFSTSPSLSALDPLLVLKKGPVWVTTGFKCSRDVFVLFLIPLFIFAGTVSDQ